MKNFLKLFYPYQPIHIYSNFIPKLREDLTPKKRKTRTTKQSRGNMTKPKEKWEMKLAQQFTQLCDYDIETGQYIDCFQSVKQFISQERTQLLEQVRIIVKESKRKSHSSGGHNACNRIFEEISKL